MQISIKFEMEFFVEVEEELSRRNIVELVDEISEYCIEAHSPRSSIISDYFMEINDTPLVIIDGVEIKYLDLETPNYKI